MSVSGMSQSFIRLCLRSRFKQALSLLLTSNALFTEQLRPTGPVLFDIRIAMLMGPRGLWMDF